MRVTFSWLDYLVFSLVLLLSLLIGVYFALRSRNEANEEYLLGGRNLHAVPVSMSLVVTYISAIAVQGGPAETYYHSIQILWGNFGALAIPVAALVYVPFYYELRLVSVNQYLEMRYKSLWARRVGSALFILQILLNQAVVIYAPALALAAVTEFPIWLSIVVVGTVASLYTAIGGMKAVVWTDAFQFVVLFGGLIVVVVSGVTEVGGLAKVWEVAVKHERAGPQINNWQVSMFERHTVWGLAWAGFLNTLSTYCCSQTAIQRYSSMKNLKHVYISVFLLLPYGFLLSALLSLTGLVLFATYVDCDPLAAGLVESKDQILPYYVMDRLSSIPGVPGVFVACIMSGALSTISSGVNSQAAVTWEDWLSMTDYFGKLSSKTQAFITKLMAFGYGMVAIGLAFIAGSMGGVLQTAVAVTFAVAGPLFAAFTLAIFVPFSNAKGSCAAMLGGTMLSLGLYFGATGIGLTPELLPTSTDGCPANITIPPPPTTPILRVEDLDYPKKLLGVSYTLLGTIGFLASCIIGILVSLATGGHNGKPIKENLVHKWVRWALPDPYPEESPVSPRYTANTRF
ncbi:sodium-dependent multivitamin transporter-like [Eriocheir sinensis]|uniref:sodium-dependent multivitamin transporter-like n=1 Tax=Eriocheir sinensis TaxID=95602 RepID=UPI0021C5DA27|nr:sodium-dependent multivitamin transporter-like [Eriocheir sinensis]XP_050715098.1 sodium-dependent multivitamin transporter-like [Eriocheir sinensis]